MILRGKLVVDFLRKLLVAFVGHVGPDDLLLGEAEGSTTSAFQGTVKYVPRIRHHLLALKDPDWQIYKFISLVYPHLSLISPIMGR